MERTANGATKKMVKLVIQMNATLNDLPLPLRKEVETVVHKMTYPMREILAKVPGETLKERAAKLKVSRQTMYVWLNEKFRPTDAQAKRISKVTGVPVEHIVDDGFLDDDARKKARKEAARLAANRAKNLKRDAGTARTRRRAGTAEDRTDPA